jgi:hypothetical protein
LHVQTRFALPIGQRLPPISDQTSKEVPMNSNRSLIAGIHRAFAFIAAVAIAALLAALNLAAVQEVSEPPYYSGQVSVPQGDVEPAVDFQTGNIVFLMSPENAPLPSKTNGAAQAPLYLVLYPTSSNISANHFVCQPENCAHFNVLPFPDPNYGALGGGETACADFNGGNPCSLVKGHDHLTGVRQTGGDSTTVWDLHLIVFTEQAFTDGVINLRITHLSQLQALLVGGYVADLPTGVSFSGTIVPLATYEKGTPVSIPFP